MLSAIKRFFQSARNAGRPDAELMDSAESSGADPWTRLAEQPLSLDAQLAVANGRMNEEAVRQRIRENVQRFRENNNPASLWALSFVDPYDWAMDTPDFYPGLGLGGGWGVPWLLNQQGRGDVLPVYINEMGLKIIRDWSRRICAFNEFALNAIENRVSYIVGKGFQYTVVEKKKPATPSLALGNEEGNEPSRLAAVAQAVLDEFISRSRWNEREQEIVRRCDRDGEAFLRFFHVGAGRTAVRFVEPEHVTQGQSYQAGHEQADSVWRQYGVNVFPGDIEDVQSYAIVENPADGAWATTDVPAKEVLHIKANTDFDSKRGLPTLFPVRKNLERADKLLRNMSVMAQVQATFAVIRKHKQFGPSSVSAYQQAATDQNVSVPVSGRNLSLRQLYPGSIIDTSEKTEYEFPSANVDASGLVAVLQAELRAIAARLVMPEFMLTVDASNANFASTMVAESPWVKKGERDQCFFARHFGDGEYGNGRQGAMWRVLANAVEGGLLPRETLTELEIQAEGPSLVVRDKAAETDRAEKLSNAGILSDTTWAKWEGLDLEQERQLGAEEKPEPSPFGGIPGESPKPAPPGSAEGMSEAVLREDEGRWITIGGKNSEGGKRHGGSPVFIKNGQIVKGAPSLTGRKIGNMKDKPADQSRRAENSQSKDYERATYAKAAKKEGIKPRHLHQLADNFLKPRS